MVKEGGLGDDIADLPAASHTSRSVSPAFAPPRTGSMSPSLAKAMAEHPVVSTITLCLISSFTITMWCSSWGLLGLLQPTTPAMPRILPLMMLSFSGR